MSSRNKKRPQQRRPVRPATAGLTPDEGDVATAEGPPATPQAPRMVPSYASGVIAPRRAAAAAAAGATIDINARVPYFISDIRRLLITAGVMLVIIIVASFLLH